MKRDAILVMVLIMAVFMMSLSIPVFAAEMTNEQKDECLLASRGCKNVVDTMQDKIKKLQAEINKGDKVYTPEEIKNLKAKLKEAEDMLDTMINKP